MIGRDDERSAGGDVFDAARCVRFDEVWQCPARAVGESALGDGVIESEAEFCGGAGGSAKDESNERFCRFGLREGKGFGQFVDQGFGEGVDFFVARVHGIVYCSRRRPRRRGRRLEQANVSQTRHVFARVRLIMIIVHASNCSA